MTDALIPRLGPRQFVGWFFQPDDLLGWKMRPNCHGWYVKPEIETLIETNDHGFRSSDIDLEKRPAGRRVLVLADSFGPAIEVTEGETFVRIMEQTLNAEQDIHQYQVVNAGVGGYSTEQEYLFLKQFGEEFQPDVVVVAFHFGDDLIENSVILRERVSWRLVKLPRPYLASDTQGNLHLQNYPPSANSVRRAWAHYYDLLPDECWLSTRNSLQPLAIDRLQRQMRRLIEVCENRLHRLKRQQSFQVELLTYCREPHEWVQQTWQHTLHLLNAIQKQCQALHAQLLVAGVCAKEQVLPGYLENRLRLSGMDIDAFDPLAPNQVFTSVLQQLAIPYLDLTPLFLEHTQAGKSLFFHSDLHWNSEGHALAGKALAQAIGKL